MSNQFLDLRNLVSQKEREWKEAVETRLEQLEHDLEAKEATLRDRESKLERVKHDFKFNLALLKERDAEIVKLESNLASARRDAHERLLANSASAVALDEARAAIQRLRDDKVALVDEMDRHASAALSEQERQRREHEATLSAVRADAAARERSLDLEVVRLRQELDSQRRELAQDAATALAERDRAAQATADEMSRRALASELRVQMLEQELVAVRAGRAEAGERAEVAERRAREAEAAGEKAAMAARSEAALREAELDEERRRGAERQRAAAAAAAEAERTRQRLEKAAGEREVALREAKELWRRERDEQRAEVEAACATFEAAQRDFEVVEATLRKEVARREEEVGGLAARAAAVEKMREEAGRMAAAVAAAAERERRAEAAATQAQIDSRRQVEEAVEAERDRVEGLVSGLVAKTGELNARLQTAEAEVAQKEMFVQGLIRERDLALQTLERHGLALDRREMVAERPEDRRERERREEEVAALRAEVERLRSENVALLTGPDLSQLRVQEEKQEKKERKERKESKKEEIKEHVGDAPIDPNSRHVRDLASAVSRLRQERVQLLAQCRKSAVRVQHVEAQAEETRAQLRARLAQVDKLEYEVGAASRQHTAQQEALKQRVTDLEGQLAESRREADEYYKGNLEAARINEGLEQDLTLLRARRPDPTPQLNLGAQELLIQQLQDEVETVREQLRAALDEKGVTARAAPGDEETERLRAKLKLAARKLVRLAEENSVLRQLSGHLRAALVKAGVPVPPGVGPRPAPRRPPSESRLKEMERLEYAIQRERMGARSRSHSPPERLTRESTGESEVEAVGDGGATPDPAASLASLWRQLGQAEAEENAGEMGVRGRAVTPRLHRDARR